MGKERTNTQSRRSAAGHLEMEDEAAVEARCCSLGPDSGFRRDTALFIGERVVGESWRDERR